MHDAQRSLHMILITKIINSLHCHMRCSVLIGAALLLSVAPHIFHSYNNLTATNCAHRTQARTLRRDKHNYLTHQKKTYTNILTYKRETKGIKFSEVEFECRIPTAKPSIEAACATLECSLTMPTKRNCNGILRFMIQS